MIYLNPPIISLHSLNLRKKTTAKPAGSIQHEKPPKSYPCRHPILINEWLPDPLCLLPFHLQRALSCEIMPA